MKKVLFIACAFGAAFAFTSCKGEPKLLTQEEINQRIETSYNEQVAVLGAQLDSLCQMNMDTYVQMAVDSIVMANTPTEPAVQ